MASAEHDIEVDLPVRAVYNQWTMFEEFPRFMEGVERVEQQGPERLHWVASVGGRRQEWDARIIEQVPDDRIAWRSESGAQNDGIVTFEPIDDGRTRVALHLEYEPEGLVEQAGSAVGVVSRRVAGDLRRFKEYLESIGHEAGGWRGTIHADASDRPLAQDLERRAHTMTSGAGSSSRNTGGTNVDPLASPTADARYTESGRANIAGQAGETMSLEQLVAMRGRPLLDANDEEIGTLDEIYYDRATRRPEWYGVDTRAGLLRRRRLVAPVIGSGVTEEFIKVPYTRAEVDAAEADDDNQLSEETEERLYRHFGIPYSRERSASGLPDDVEPMAPAPPIRTEDVVRSQAMPTTAPGEAARPYDPALVSGVEDALREPPPSPAAAAGEAGEIEYEEAAWRSSLATSATSSAASGAEGQVVPPAEMPAPPRYAGSAPLEPPFTTRWLWALPAALGIGVLAILRLRRRRER